MLNWPGDDRLADVWVAEWWANGDLTLNYYDHDEGSGPAASVLIRGDAIDDVLGILRDARRIAGTTAGS